MARAKTLLEWVMQCAMFWPLACYLMVLGLFNSARRPVLVPGSADTAGLCCALSGLIVIGPLGLIVRPLVRHGETYPLVVAATVFFVVSLLVIGSGRRRLVIYNCTAEQFHRIWSKVLARADAQAKNLGNLFVLPSLGISVRVDEFPALQNVSLVADSDAQAPEGWKTLEHELSAALSESQRRARSLKAPLLMWAVCVVVLLAPFGWLLADQASRLGLVP